VARTFATLVRRRGIVLAVAAVVTAVAGAVHGIHPDFGFWDGPV
jgi:uncharacterized protein involved in exopolysaccharide biosynthesis